MEVFIGWLTQACPSGVIHRTASLFSSYLLLHQRADWLTVVLKDAASRISSKHDRIFLRCSRLPITLFVLLASIWWIHRVLGIQLQLGRPSQLGLWNTPTKKGNTPPNKQSEGEAPVILKLLGLLGTLSLLSILGPLWPEVVAPNRVLSIDQTELN